ncbi:hypothetical protein Ancab_039571 [Ancistrocladus abbreviatus]
MSTASAHSGSTSDGKDLREFDSDEEYQALWERLDQMFHNLWDVEAKLEDQVFHVFKDQAHYRTAREDRAEGFKNCLSTDIEMRLQRKERKVPRLLEEIELHTAAREGHVENILQILHRNVDLIANEDSKGDLPLHEEASAGQQEAVITLTLFTKRYVKPKLSIGKANKEGNTALHLVIQNGHEKVAWYLIQSCPETSNSLNKEGVSPLHRAIEARF